MADDQLIILAYAAKGDRCTPLIASSIWMRLLV